MRKVVTVSLEHETLETVNTLAHALNVSRSEMVTSLLQRGLRKMTERERKALELERMKERRLK